MKAVLLLGLLLSLSLCYMVSVETGWITETVLCVGLLTTNSRPGAYRQDQSALSTGLVVMATGGPHYWYLVQSLGPSWQTDISQSYKLHLIATTVSLPAESSLMNLLKELRSCSTGYGLQLVAIVFNYWYLVVQRRYRYSAGWLYPTLTVNYFEINYSTSSDHKYYTTRWNTVILCGNQLSCPLRTYCSHKGTTRSSRSDIFIPRNSVSHSVPGWNVDGVANQI